MAFNEVRVGSFLLFNDEFPCKVTQLNKSKPGKHGSAKYTLYGKDLLTGKTKNMVAGHHDRPHFVEVTRRTLLCSYFDDDYAYTIDDGGEEESFQITNEELLEAKDNYEDGECNISVIDVTYTVKDKRHEHSVVVGISELKD